MALHSLSIASEVSQVACQVGQDVVPLGLGQMNSGPERIEDSHILYSIVEALASVEEVRDVVAPVKLGCCGLDSEPWDVIKGLSLVSELLLI